MGKRGPAPKPAAVAKLAGDRRRAKQVEPKPPEGTPPTPRNLGPIAKEEWGLIVEELASMNVIARVDRMALTLYVEAYERYRKAAETVEEKGETIFSPNGYPQVAPWVTRMDKNLEVCRRFLIEFGLTPAARSRMALPTAKAAVDAEWGEILNDSLGGK